MSHSIDCYKIECLSISGFVASGVVTVRGRSLLGKLRPFRPTSALFSGAIVNIISLE